jgi:acylphosphatase
MELSIRVVISGRVQGVGYRAWTVAAASKMQLKGWVRNRNDGSVEAVFNGEEADVHAMIEACKEGPPASRVNSIESYAWKEEIEAGPFVARPTV